MLSYSALFLTPADQGQSGAKAEEAMNAVQEKCAVNR